MKLLPIQTFRNGVFYNQIARTSITAFYSLQYSVVGPIIGFDVFRIHLRGERVFKGKTIPRHEHFPWNDDYGVSAWSFSSEKDARNKFNEISSK